ncbi:MAG: pitrilysin family protein [Nitrospirota bacterium]
MKYLRLPIIILFLALFSVTNGLASEVREYTLENGLKVIIIEEHKAPVATFQVWYRVGTKDEPAGRSGLSHLLEHMMFKGTSKYGPSMLSKIIQKNGGTDNAYTTKDYTVYFELLSSDRIGISVDLEADRMQNLTLEPKEALSERKVVMEERRLRYEDDPQRSLLEEVMAAAFKVHPYQRPVIGWSSHLEQMDPEDLFKYYKTYYAPNNAVIIVVGDISGDAMIKHIREAFEDIPKGPAIEAIGSAEPEQRGERRLILKRDAELPYVLAAYHTPSFPDEDSYALDVLNVILSGGKSSRLYQSMVYEKKIALDADADYDGLSENPYVFLFDATAAPGRDIKDVEAALFEEVDKIKEAPPSEREIQKAKNQIEASFVMGQDSIYLQAMKYGMFEMLGGWGLTNTYLEGIRKVRPEDVSRVARKYLSEDNRTVGILVPTKKVNSEK